MTTAVPLVAEPIVCPPWADRGTPGSWIVPRLTGWGVAFDLLLSGRTFTADETAHAHEFFFEGPKEH